jgi:hypothetical protein
MDETNSLEDQENAQGEGKGGGYRNRMLWGCACSYLFSLPVPGSLRMIILLERK